ncbi:DegV family protein with EDD domain [Paenibacillus taihuensis]|uniref:DegV family protein with EDD domain n=1 Tax=Paenibacillus taihuensis TaxID=1156355 RepID=A0A3D9S6J7_9BACL|nr:DegV family protein [Paenibacillus taihuensis]REE88618.1 DegV family protein with EDD domain [Paenibacillus taihuensis]
MSAVKIITDSTADVPKRVREQYGIEMVPLKVLFGEQSFLDGVTITNNEFYERLAKADMLPKTSQPSPTEFMEMYERQLAQKPDQSIISIHLASALSGTYQSAVLGSNLLETPGDITVIDSKSASYGCGMLVVKAAEMAAAGEPKERIVEKINDIIQDRKMYFLLDTLDYLQKGGRIGKAAALFGSILNIKPILSIDQEGVVTAVDKVRGTKKAMQRIVDLFKQDFGDDPVEMTVGWTHKSELAKELAALAQTQLKVVTIRQTEIGSVIGTHAGPGAAALFITRV